MVVGEILKIHPNQSGINKEKRICRNYCGAEKMPALIDDAKQAEAGSALEILTRAGIPKLILGTRASRPHLVEKCGQDARVPKNPNLTFAGKFIRRLLF